MQRETREESVERIFNFLGHKTDQAPASIKEALFQAYDAATGVAAEGSPSKTLREKVQKLAFHHECDQGGGKYIVLLDDIDALLAAEGIPEDRLADKIEYLGEGASEGYQLACRDVAKLLRWGWPFLDPVAAEGGQPCRNPNHALTDGSPHPHEIGPSCMAEGSQPSATRDWAEVWAQDFHDTYERMAPQFGYETRKESAKPWSDVPEKNRKLMIAVCAEVLCRWEKTRHGAEGGQPSGPSEAALHNHDDPGDRINRCSSY